MALAREGIIPTEQLPLVSKVSCHVGNSRSPWLLLLLCCTVECIRTPSEIRSSSRGPDALNPANKAAGVTKGFWNCPHDNMYWADVPISKRSMFSCAITWHKLPANNTPYSYVFIFVLLGNMNKFFITTVRLQVSMWPKWHSSHFLEIPRSSSILYSI
jgi:hypothetical protein